MAASLVAHRRRRTAPSPYCATAWTTEPFNVRHVTMLAIMPGPEEPDITLEGARALAKDGQSRAVVGNDGRTYAIFGYFTPSDEPDTATAWAIMARGTARCFVRIDREVRRMVDECPRSAITFLIAREDHRGREWLERMGFQVQLVGALDVANLYQYIRRKK